MHWNINNCCTSGDTSNSEILSGITCDEENITQNGNYVKHVGKLDVDICIPVITVNDGIDDNNYSIDIEALPVAFPQEYTPVVRLDGKDNTYYGGRDQNGNVINTSGFSTRVSLNESAVVKTEEQGRRLNWFHFDSDVDGNITIPIGAQSWSITILDPNSSDPIITMFNTTRSVPAPVGVISGSSESDNGKLNHVITTNANGNRLYVVYAITV